jgi:hypothetical protein
MKPRQVGLLASAIIASALGYVYYELSGDQLEGRYTEESFLTVAWAVMFGFVVFCVLAIFSRVILPDEE